MKTKSKLCVFSYRFSRVHQPQWASPAPKQSPQLLHWSQSATFTLSICTWQHTHTNSMVSMSGRSNRLLWRFVQTFYHRTSVIDYSFLSRKNTKHSPVNSLKCRVSPFCLIVNLISRGCGPSGRQNKLFKDTDSPFSDISYTSMWKQNMPSFSPTSSFKPHHHKQYMN